MLNAIRTYRRNRYVTALIRRGLKLGKNVELNDGFFLDPSHCELITIEDDVVFGPRVSLFAHDASSKKVVGNTKVAPVLLKRNCFIGANSTILPGVTVGQNSIVAAGSVVTRPVPENEVWGGNPARLLMTVSEYREKLTARTDVKFIP